ncbi:hypothetical protein CHS0354_030887, partial [Potamilus streckersoni]
KNEKQQTTLNRYMKYPNQKKSPILGGSESNLPSISESDGAHTPCQRLPEL